LAPGSYAAALVAGTNSNSTITKIKLHRHTALSTAQPTIKPRFSLS
jgi:hypothetical protein